MRQKLTPKRQTNGSAGKADLVILGIECYNCHTIGHVAVDCPKFGDIKGNIQKEFLKKIQDGTSG